MAGIGKYLNYEVYMSKRIERYNRLFHSNSKFKRVLARYMFNRSKRICSCNIYPGATFGHNIYLVHPTNIGIGESAVLGNNITIYPGVHLAANFAAEDKEDGRRHPKICDDVILCVNALIIGGVTIGRNSIVGGGAIVTHDVPENTIVIGVNQHRPNHYHNRDFLIEFSGMNNRNRIMRFDERLLKE